MKTCITTAQKPDGAHVCLYCGPDAAAALDKCVSPGPGYVRTAAFIRAVPSKVRQFAAPAAEQAPENKTDKADKTGKKSSKK